MTLELKIPPMPFDYLTIVIIVHTHTHSLMCLGSCVLASGNLGSAEVLG